MCLLVILNYLGTTDGQITKCYTVTIIGTNYSRGKDCTVCTGEGVGGDSIERILRKLLERATCKGFKWLRSKCMPDGCVHDSELSSCVRAGDLLSDWANINVGCRSGRGGEVFEEPWVGFGWDCCDATIRVETLKGLLRPLCSNLQVVILSDNCRFSVPAASHWACRLSVEGAALLRQVSGNDVVTDSSKTL